MCSQRLKLAMKYLNVLTLNFTNVVLTFDQNEKFRTEHVNVATTSMTY